MERPPERRRGYHLGPISPCRGAARNTRLTSPRAFHRWPDAGVRTQQTLLGLRLCPTGQEGLGQSDSQEASGHQGLCKVTSEVTSLCPGGRAWPGSRALPPLPASLCLCAWGREGLQGGQHGPRRDVRTVVPCVVPKIVKPRNH